MHSATASDALDLSGIAADEQAALALSREPAESVHDCVIRLRLALIVLGLDRELEPHVQVSPDEEIPQRCLNATLTFLEKA